MVTFLEIKDGRVTFNPPYFDDLVTKTAPEHRGRLPRAIEAHALWYYYVLAFKAWHDAEQNIVYEDEPSKRFDVRTARMLIERVAQMYGTTPIRMVKYWPAVENQRRALQYTSNADLPDVFKFRYS